MASSHAEREQNIYTYTYTRRYDKAAIAGGEQDVRAVGFGEARRALEEFFGIHEWIGGVMGSCST